MIDLDGDRIAAAAGAEIAAGGPDGSPAAVSIDSREVGKGDLFVALRGERDDGGEYAQAALDAGAWGVIVETGRAKRLADGDSDGWVISAGDPLAALQSLARSWRRELGCPVIGITGSTGKTSVKDVCRELLPVRVHASPENYNTEIGLPLAILSAARDTEALVLEMAMRGSGQIRELAEIAEPEVGVITNVGPVHVELLGSLDAIARAKAELLGELRPGGTAVVPVDAGPLAPYLEAGEKVLRFGPGGEVFAEEISVDGGETEALVWTPAGEQRFRFPFTEAHNLENALAAIAAGVALELPLAKMAERAPRIVFSRLRGELVQIEGGSTLINDCYNANPMSMRAALDHLGSFDAKGRRIAVLGEMRELGPEAPAYHREVGEHARRVGVEHLIGVGEMASHYAPDEQVPDAAAAADALAGQLGEGDAVLVKGSRAVGLEEVAERLGSRPPDRAGPGSEAEEPANG